MEHKNVRELTVKISGSQSAFTEPVASPMTELAMNFQGICNTRTPTGPTKGTPRRKLSLEDVENNAATPILSRSLSSESGYCASPDSYQGHGAMASMDSPSADFISSRRRSYSKVSRKPEYLRSISSPLTSKFEKENQIPEEQIDTNNNKENEFQFVKPTMPVYRTHSGKRMRPISAPPALSPNRPQWLSSGSNGVSTRFSVDEDDDGFIDYTQLECEDDAFTSYAVHRLMTAPITAPPKEQEEETMECQGNTPKAVKHVEPSHLFRPVQCDPSSTSEQRSRRSKSLSMKRPNPPRDPSPEVRKKIRGRCSSAQEASWNSPLLIGGDRPPVKRSQSLVESKTRMDIDKLLSPANDQSCLTGDLTRQNILPTIKGQHDDLKTISPETVTQVLDGEFAEIDQVFIVDCRYPYEYEGGHIMTAINLHTKEDGYEFFLNKPKSSPDKRTVIIYHCEFSSKRAPNMYRFVRNKDRDAHRHCYPKLFYPEMYVIKGGYKAFYETCQTYCEPRTYLPMAHEDYTQELKRFSRRSKSWTDGQTVRKTYRQGLKF